MINKSRTFYPFEEYLFRTKNPRVFPGGGDPIIYKIIDKKAPYLTLLPISNWEEKTLFLNFDTEGNLS